MLAALKLGRLVGHIRLLHKTTPFDHRSATHFSAALAGTPVSPKTATSCLLISGTVFLPSHSSNTIARSEEHTSELQSLRHLVCRLLLEKKIEIIEQRRHRCQIQRAYFRARGWRFR